MKLVLPVTGVAFVLAGTEAPKINLVFSNWFSFLLIVFLLLGFIAWVTYIATSVARIKKNLSEAITKAELKKAFEDFRLEIQGP